MALAMLIKHIEFRQLDSDGAASAILEAHRSLAGDASLRQHLLDGVLRGLSCAQAIVESANHFCNEFARASSSYLQERALDVRDVCFQLLQHILRWAALSGAGPVDPAIYLYGGRVDAKPVPRTG
ncbi:phosphoenolpyruvate-protein phosphotransferase [Salmonella enterica subsp. enterica]|uniref:Phosphoenolpyruvate-protein phosphotransferase n=1 Tax=Salmonella enterica I TaxID=59201 RepID=A0A3S4J805_SALET|nr:phosphoenolpyruvate-protein phosphotransferase [Salmonella enterica subsp. enterica]